jgi:hypothetical protein
MRVVPLVKLLEVFYAVFVEKLKNRSVTSDGIDEVAFFFFSPTTAGRV